MFRPKHFKAKFEDIKEVLSNANANTNEIKNFIDEKHMGLVGQITPSKEQFFKRPLVAVYYDIDWKKDKKGSGYYRNRVARVAKKFIGEITFAVASKNDYQRQIGDWDLKGKVVAVARNEKGQVFRL